MNRRRSLLWLGAMLAMATPAHADWRAWLDDVLKRSDKGARLDAKTIAAGLREALEQGTGRAVMALGRENGFWSHPRLRIPMPPALQKAEKTLRRLGQDRVADEFLLSLNRAAERATPAARDIFVQAIRDMTMRDAVDILEGEQDAATQYFRRQTHARLAQAFLPIVGEATRGVGVTARYKKLVKSVDSLGVVDTRDLDVDRYVTERALDGLFALVAEEEKRIRTDPAARTTELLRRVFR